MNIQALVLKFTQPKLGFLHLLIVQQMDSSKPLIKSFHD